jgi:hypothetical protein
MHPDYATTPGRAAKVEEIDAMVTAWTRERSKNEVMAILTEAHVPCAPVRTAAEVVADPHLNARGVWQEIDHPRRGKTKVPISPIRLHGADPVVVARLRPLLSELDVLECRCIHVPLAHAREILVPPGVKVVVKRLPLHRAVVQRNPYRVGVPELRHNCSSRRIGGHRGPSRERCHQGRRADEDNEPSSVHHATLTSQCIARCIHLTTRRGARGFGPSRT